MSSILNGKTVYNLQEVADLLGKKKGTIYRYIYSKKGKFLNESPLFTEDDFDKYEIPVKITWKEYLTIKGKLPNKGGIINIATSDTQVGTAL
jgi:hypothetical protein